MVPLLCCRYYENFIKKNIFSLAKGENCGKNNKIEKKYKLNELQSEDNKLNKQNNVLLSKLNEDNLNFDDFHSL